MLWSLKTTLLASGISALLAFGAGWAASQWRQESKQLAVQKKQTSEYAAQVDELATHLDNTVAAANAAAEKTQKSLEDINAVVSNKNTALAVLSRQTREIQGEISKLLDTNCPVPAEYQRVQSKISETANSNRDKLYGPVD